MRRMHFGSYVQYSFWGNVEYGSNKEALRARNKMAREMKAGGKKVTLHRLFGQTRKYDSFGRPDGRTGNVYKLDVYS